jgi:hypothetical protein
VPNKHNAKRRQHIPKMKFKVTNWAEYDAGLWRRGSLTLWVTDEAMAGWRTAGGQSSYSDLAIETGLMLRLAFHCPSRRAMMMASISKGCRLPDGPLHLLTDSTGTGSLRRR